MTTSTCDTCRAPGSCCRGLVLIGISFNVAYWKEEATAAMAKRDMSYFVPVRLPVSTMMDRHAHITQVIFDCTRLGADGRCTDYENRPGLCRTYQAKSEPLCAEYVHNLKGIPIHVVQTDHQSA